jgi:metal-dependent amidase/aminoacylase/carboxypeptidase family protein
VIPDPVDHLVELRRDIHAHPEVAGHERRTAGLVARELRAAGLDVTTGVGGHGVVAILTGALGGRTVAYRADMDAVPPDVQVRGGPVAAHVCGHDLHTAIGVGVALRLARARERLAGTVMFLFQPGEEDLTGAAAMLAGGVFDRARPAEIHALHCYALPVGEFAVLPGSGLPGQDRGFVAGPDAAALAAEINALGDVTPPVTSADFEELVAGGRTDFVFMQARVTPAGLRVTYRCWPEHRYVEVREAVRRIAPAVRFPADPFPALVVPEREAEELRRYLGRERTRVHRGAVPLSGDDFALFLDGRPGTYTLLGVRAPGAPIETAYPHLGTFDPDERAIGHGVRAMAGWLAVRTQINH